MGNSNDRVCVRVRVRVRAMNDRDSNVDCCQLGRDCVDELKNIEIYNIIIIFWLKYTKLLKHISKYKDCFSINYLYILKHFKTIP